MIPQQIIEEIRDRVDIVQLVSEVLDLKKAGRNFKALCPFHSEKTPSFMVHPEKQIYHCFGCGKGGNVFHFLMDYEGIGFVEAVRKLGNRVGIDVESYLLSGQSQEKLEPYYRAMEFAARFYRKMLLEAKEARVARDYLDKREIGEDKQEEFTIGFAPAGWDNLYRAAMDAKIPREILLELCLIAPVRGGSGYRDYFRSRVIFPIESLTNRFVGLAGRVLDDSEPKYLNTAESPIYKKGRMLYGLNRSKDYIRKDATALIVEGYIDYLTLWKKGIKNVAAVCGTSFTQDQARLLARYANRVYIINDGDRAGIRAAVRAADELLIGGLESNIVLLPEGEDPDSFVRKHGAEEFNLLVRSAPNYFAFLKSEAERGERKTYRKGLVIEHILQTVATIPDEVRKELLLQEISSLFDVSVSSLRSGLPRKDRMAAAGTRSKVRPIEESRREKIQKMLFRLALENESYARKVLERIDVEDLEGKLFMDYYRAMEEAISGGIDVRSPAFISSISDTELSKLATEIALGDLPPGPHDRLLEDTIQWLRREVEKQELETMKAKIKALEAEGGKEAKEQIRMLTKMYEEVSRKLKAAKSEGGDSN